MSAELKPHLAVYGGGRTMTEKWLIGKHMFNFKFTVMRGPGLHRTTLFLGFNVKFSRILKLLLGITYLIFVSLFHFRSMFQCFLFMPEYRSIEEKIGPKNQSGTFLFLVKILKKFLCTLRMINNFSWFYQSNLIEIEEEGDFYFQVGKSWFSILHHIPFIAKEFQ